MKHKQTCKICDRETQFIYNINLKAVHICEKCGRQIARQEIEDMFNAQTND